MSYYYKIGNIPHKRHTQFRQADGSLYHEEVMGIHGFSGIQSILYHLRPPTQIKHVETLGPAEITYEEQGPLRHRHFLTADAPAFGDAIQARFPILGNHDVCMYVARPTEAMPYWYKHSGGDDVLFIHDGTGLLETQFGNLRYRPGDYLVIPTGVMWRFLPDEGVEQRMLVVEAKGHIEPPKRYFNHYGQFLEHSPYCERDIRPPDELDTHEDVGEYEVRVKSRGVITRVIYGHHPLDVIGWDGHLWPFAFNIEDFEPITGRVHQPPPVHQTFAGPGFILCSFVPRLFDYHPLSIPAPYNHSNVDSDEVIYYAEGNFMSRKDTKRASITVHPSGVPHGPDPGTYEGSIGKERTDEIAVMVDTFHPLKVATVALKLEDEAYLYSWNGSGMKINLTRPG